MVRPTVSGLRREYKFNIKIRVMRLWSPVFGRSQVISTFVGDTRVGLPLLAAGIAEQVLSLAPRFEVVD